MYRRAGWQNQFRRGEANDMTNEEIIRAVEEHCRDGLNDAKNYVSDAITRVGYLAKTLETILWECERRDAEPCDRCGGGGLAIGSDRRGQYAASPGKCPDCKGTGRRDAATNAEDDVWTALVNHVKNAWPTENVVWSESPLELVTRLIDERDEAVSRLGETNAGDGSVPLERAP